ncbi:unnamed protein product [Symbiodinium sp. CCMP2592]|nr:unnamed protein product [Symbiodinium sp. CCMP2592]
MLGTFAGTGELEQNFSFAEMFTAGRKGSVTVENLRNMLKVRLDGLPPHEFVVSCQEGAHSLSIEKPSEDCVRTQQRFIQLFGGGSNGRAHDLPRRRKKQRTVDGSIDILEGQETVASLKRKRSMQLESLQPEQRPDVQQLAEQAAAAAEATKANPSYQNLSKRLSALAEAKRRQFLEDAGPAGGVIAAKYAAALSKEQRLQELLQKLAEDGHALEPSQQPAMDPMNTIIVFQSDAGGHDLSTLGAETCVWNGHEDQLAKLMQKRNIIWFLGDAKAEMAFIMPQGSEVEGFLVGSRLLGGYVATQCWAKACAQHNLFLQPPLHLAGALRSKRNLMVYVHKSAAEQHLAAATCVVRAAHAAGSHIPDVRLVLKNKWKDVSAKGALVLTAPGDVRKAKKRQLKDKLKGCVLDPLGFLSVCTEWGS